MFVQRFSSSSFCCRSILNKTANIADRVQFCSYSKFTETEFGQHPLFSIDQDYISLTYSSYVQQIQANETPPQCLRTWKSRVLKHWGGHEDMIFAETFAPTWFLHFLLLLPVFNNMQPLVLQKPWWGLVPCLRNLRSKWTGELSVFLLPHNKSAFQFCFEWNMRTCEILLEWAVAHTTKAEILGYCTQLCFYQYIQFTSMRFSAIFTKHGTRVSFSFSELLKFTKTTNKPQ